MAIYHGYDGVISVGAVDLTDHCTEFEVVESYGDLPTTAMGSTHETRIAGLGSFVLTATFQQDQQAAGAGAVYATLQPLVGTVAAFTGQATSAAISATNAELQGNVLVSEFSHMHPAPGNLDTFSVSWAGTGLITVDVVP